VSSRYGGVEIIDMSAIVPAILWLVHVI